MRREQSPPLVAGSDFSLLLTSLRDDAQLPEQTAPEDFSEELLEDLTDFDLTLRLGSSSGGRAAVVGTEQSAAGSAGDGSDLTLRRVGQYYFMLNVPGAATAAMNEGELVLTLALRHRPTGTVQMAETKLQNLIKVREVQI